MNFGVFQPNMAWTLLVIIIPIIIHLLSRSKGKILKVAYTHLISSPKQKPVADIRLERPWLLLLRLLMLILLSLLLMQSWFEDTKTPINDQPVIVVSPNWLNVADAEQREALAQAVQESPTSSFLISVPTSRISAQQVRQWQTSSTITVNNVWAQIASVSNNFATRQPLSIYAIGSEADFWGTKSQLRQDINWHLLKTPTTLDAKKPIKIVLSADTDTPYLVNWQQALFALKQGPLPELEIETVASNVVLNETQGVDWLVHLSANSARNDHDIEQIAALNKAAKQVNFPFLLGQAIIEKRRHVISHYAELTEEQISEKGGLIEIIDDSVSMQKQPPKNNANTLKILVILLIIAFCAERIVSEQGRRKRVSTQEKT